MKSDIHFQPLEMVPPFVELFVLGYILSRVTACLGKSYRRIVRLLWRPLYPLSIAAGLAPFLRPELTALAIPFLMARYVLGEYMLRYPIIYLRAFGMRETPEVYGLIGTKALKAYGMSLAVFHENKLPHTFHRHASLWGVTRPIVLSDTDWRAPSSGC